jgi:hypothetical protein
MKIAIVAYYFYPNNSIGSVRPEFWANWLAKNHDVYVITNKSGNYNDSIFTFHIKRRNSYILNLIYFLRNKKSKNTTNSKLSKTGVLSYRMPCLHDLWILPSLIELIKCNPDVVISTHNPYANHISSYLYCKLYKKKLITDYRDLWTNSPFFSGISGFNFIEKYIEKLILKKSIYITTVSQGLKNKLSTLLPNIDNKIKVIYNTSFTRIVNTSKNNTKDLIFSYTGTIYKNWRDPSPFFNYISNLKKFGIVSSQNCKIIFASQNPGDFFELANLYKVTEFIDYKGSVSRNESFKLQDKSDVLLLFEANNKNEEGVLTGKVFEYLATNKPILLIGPDQNSELYKLINEHNRLINFENLNDFYIKNIPLPKMREVNIGQQSEKDLNSIIDNV